MPPKGRKVAFSAKQKKKQLQDKKERKTNVVRNEFGIAIHQRNKKKGDINKINQQPQTSSTQPDRNRYLLHFKRETDEEVEKGKALARLPIIPLSPQASEIDLAEIYVEGLDMPHRPIWNYNLSKQALNNNEMKYFNTYLNEISSRFAHRQTSYFELNIETWRQLWRVVEMSDVVLLITDARHPALHFSPSLYDYVVKKCAKKLVLVLNKIDLVPAPLLLAWKKYFTQHYPSLPIVLFTSSPSPSPLDLDPQHTVFKVGKKPKRRYCSVGPLQLWHVCKDIVKGKVDLDSWKEKIVYDAVPEEDEEDKVEEEDDSDDDDDDDDGDDDNKDDSNNDDDCDSHDDDDDDDDDGSNVTKSTNKEDAHTHDDDDDDDDDDGMIRKTEEKYNFCNEGMLTIGCCGYPNVGKSSVINSLVGKKVVSVSRTPGHTKHFQTIKLTNNLTLCDSPGLVFPSLIDKPLQIISGMYPIAQVREPYSCVRFLAERLPLPDLMRLKREGEGVKGGAAKVNDRVKGGEGGDDDCGLVTEHEPWTAYSICDSWAEQRGFLTARAARNDVYRAGNHILRMTEQSRICLCLTPPNYHAQKHAFENSEEVKELIEMQVSNKVVTRRR